MIFNQTQKVIISPTERRCYSIFSQGFGLMFRRKQNLIMFFPQEHKVKLHMFFVFYPIDVLLLDKHHKIIEIKRNFRPFTFWNSREKAHSVVEMAFPSASNIGDVIKF